MDTHNDRRTTRNVVIQSSNIQFCQHLIRMLPSQTQVQKRSSYLSDHRTFCVQQVRGKRKIYPPLTILMNLLTRTFSAYRTENKLSIRYKSGLILIS